jgi:hypothetical protein
MSESLSIDDNWEEPLDSDQVTHVKGEIAAASAAAGEWLVNVSGQIVVPMTTAELVEAVRTRRVTDRSLVWRAGMQEWTLLGEVPQLRLAAGPVAAPAPAAVAARVAPQPSERPAPPASERMLHPPPKEPARAARDERVRRNTLPFGFPVVRDPATIREPVGLHAAPAPTAAEPARTDDVDALAIYERAAPSLTFSDSVRAEWEGTGKLVHQPAVASGPPPAPTPRPRLEPRLEPKPRLSLEPQSDPMQSARAEVEPKASRSQPPSSLAPTTSEPENPLPARAAMWGDLSVVLAKDMRAVKATSKRVTLIASLGSAALASLLTLWFAHSSGHAAEGATAAQPPTATATVQVAAAPPAVVAPAAPVIAASAAAVATPSSVATHSVVKPAAPRASAPRVVSRPKRAPPPEAAAPAVAAESDPYADPTEPAQPKTPTAAFKETNLAPAAPTATAATTTQNTPAKAPAPSAPSGLEDGASAVRPAATAVPGF